MSTDLYLSLVWNSSFLSLASCWKYPYDGVIINTFGIVAEVFSKQILTLAGLDFEDLSSD